MNKLDKTLSVIRGILCLILCIFLFTVMLLYLLFNVTHKIINKDNVANLVSSLDIKEIIGDDGFSTIEPIYEVLEVHNIDKELVDGILNCTSTGALYTTNPSSETTDHANITSNGGGKVIYNTLGSNTKIYQVNQSGTSVSTVNLPVAPARLLNAKGNILYQVPDDNETYTYRDGIWRNENIDGISPNIPAVKNNIPTFTVSPSYTFSTYVGESQSTPTDIVTANDNVDWTSTSVTWAYSIVGQDADQFSFTWGGTQPSATVTFTPESEGVKKAVLRITATYEKAYDYNASKKHKHIYTKDVQLIGNASYLKTNTLAFEDLNVLYTGQGAIPLFKANSQNNRLTKRSAYCYKSSSITAPMRSETSSIVPRLGMLRCFPCER